MTEDMISKSDSPPRLPLELILDIISKLLPDEPRALLPSHEAIKTLVSFTRVCHGTSQVASRYLSEYCWARVISADHLRGMVLRLQEPNAPPLTSLYLAPFSATHSYSDQSRDGHSMAWWIRELLGCVQLTLRRLVVDMPLREEWNVTAERTELRQGFMGLTRLEELVSVRDELYMTTYHHPEPVWRLWPDLHRLALYNPDADAHFWHSVAAMAGLKSLVLTRPDGDWDWNDDGCCIKTEFFSVARPDRRIDVVLANVHELESFPPPRSTWSSADPEGRMRVVLYDVPCEFGPGIDPISICQEHVRRAALDGTIWDWHRYGHWFL